MDLVGNDVDTLHEEIEYLMDYLVGNDVDTLHEEIEHLVCHLVENNVDTLHEERIHLVGFSFIRVYDMIWHDMIWLGVRISRWGFFGLIHWFNFSDIALIHTTTQPTIGGILPKAFYLKCFNLLLYKGISLQMPLKLFFKRQK